VKTTVVLEHLKERKRAAVYLHWLVKKKKTPSLLTSSHQNPDYGLAQSTPVLLKWFNMKLNQPQSNGFYFENKTI